MKRLTAILVILAMTLCFGACGGNKNDGSQTNLPEDTEENTEIPEDTEEIEEDSDLGDYTLLFFQDGPLALVYDHPSYKIGALDSSGKLAIPCEYREMYYIGHDRYVVSNVPDNLTCLYGIVDLEGNVILPCEYETLGVEITDERDPLPELTNMEYFLKDYKDQENVIISAQKKKGDPLEYYSIIDGKVVKDPDEDEIMRFDIGDEEAPYADIAAEIPVPDSIKNKYDHVFPIPYGSNALIDTYGVQCHYYGVWNDDDNGIRIVNAEGKEIGNGKKWYDAGVEYGNGLICVTKDNSGLWALIDSEGNEVTDYIFEVWLDNA